MSKLTQNDTAIIRSAIAKVDRCESYLMTGNLDRASAQQLLVEASALLHKFLHRKGYTR